MRSSDESVTNISDNISKNDTGITSKEETDSNDIVSYNLGKESAAFAMTIPKKLDNDDPADHLRCYTVTDKDSAIDFMMITQSNENSLAIVCFWKKYLLISFSIL